MKIKTKVNQWDLIKVKSFCTAKKTVKNKQKDNPQNERKIFANEAIDKRFISKIYKHLIEIMYIHTHIYIYIYIYIYTHSQKKWAEDLDISPKKTDRWPKTT